MANDAMFIGVDKIIFTQPKKAKLNAYLIGVAGDNTGNVIVTDPFSSVRIKHLPKKGAPAVWDFGGEGYPLYQKTGGLADIVVYHLIVVRDKSRARRGGEIITQISQNVGTKKVFETASTTLAGLSGPAAIFGATAVAALNPILGLIGNILGTTKDKVLTTFSGSFILTPDRKDDDEFSEEITAPDASMKTELDILLFDAVIEGDSVADLSEAETEREASRLFFTRKNAQDMT